jgi:hypothetical protein
LLFDVLRIAIEHRLRSVMTVALSALIALRANTAMTSFNLSFGGVARGTFKNAELYAAPMPVSSLPDFLINAMSNNNEVGKYEMGKVRCPSIYL